MEMYMFIYIYYVFTKFMFLRVFFLSVYIFRNNLDFFLI